MRIPTVHGWMDRRILANFQVDPVVLANVLPEPFRPKLVNGVGIAGICLIRLKHIKPRYLTGEFGLGSENAAHRIAVEWSVDGQSRQGVYIPRRDSSSHLSTLLGGRLFSGVHHHAQFDVVEGDGRYHVALDSDDALTHVCVDGRISSSLPVDSTFRSLSEASRFFEAGSLGYSATARRGEYDGLELHSHQWKVEPLAVEKIESSFFENARQFPKGSIRFDCALIMRGIEHEWHGKETLCYPLAV
jgi:hypothetical protein